MRGDDAYSDRGFEARTVAGELSDDDPLQAKVLVVGVAPFKRRQFANPGDVFALSLDAVEGDGRQARLIRVHPAIDLPAFAVERLDPLGRERPQPLETLSTGFG